MRPPQTEAKSADRRPFGANDVVGGGASDAAFHYLERPTTMGV